MPAKRIAVTYKIPTIELREPGQQPGRTSHMLFVFNQAGSPIKFGKFVRVPPVCWPANVGILSVHMPIQCNRPYVYNYGI